MRRISASLIIVVSWAATAAAVFVATYLSRPLGIAAFILTVAVAIITARYFAHATRALRSAVSTATREANERALLANRAEQQLSAVIESITEGILQVSANARLLHVNPAARQLLNLPTRVEGQPVAALIRNPELRLCIEQAAAGSSFEPVEVTVDERHLLISPRPLRSEQNDQQFSGAVIAIVDLTEFRRLEIVRRDFVANVSHELKTPLTSIRGYTETLLADDLPPETQKQFLEVVHKNAERIQRIVDDLLDLSRLQSGGWDPELQDVDPVALAEDVWASCEGARRKGIRFDVAARTERHIRADPAGLRHVLSNLFDNAIRYTPANGAVHVTVAQPDNNGGMAGEPYVELMVRDSGTGIPAEALPRIFERFYRVDPARSRQEGGTGLGLSIVKHLVERMAGEVSAESELGKGTTIRIKLPAAAD
ncbi:MAG TPA: ATP-binding protein [Longimicrobiales bacterium]